MKRKLWCFKGDAVKSFPNACFCFGHNLVISYPNLVIQIDKYTRLIVEQTP